MELQVNDQIRIVTDAYNYIVQGSRIVKEDTKLYSKGDVVWEDLTYHANLPDAYKSMLDKGIMIQDSFNAVMAYINKVEKMILDLKKQKTK